jgi:hypothetical protein
MWLLNTTTLILEEFTEDSVPEYCILSHTWFSRGEVTFRLIRSTSPADRKAAEALPGYAKLRDSCHQAVRDKFKWIWIDTCCIDKESSAELSEAINSMFRWYKEAKVCYAYLSDVPDDADVDRKKGSFYRSRWFTRGWTLQELLAPSVVYFFTSGWKRLGSKTLLRSQISEITKIGETFLTGEESIWNAAIAKRMSWAGNRKTTRTEDQAYCLLGLFDVNMPLLYGEGKKAFLRLQEEIIRSSTDQTIFAWGFHPARADKGPTHEELRHFSEGIPLVSSDSGLGKLSGFLASSPSDFDATSAKFVPDELAQSLKPFSLTNFGIQIELGTISKLKTNPVVIACRREDDLHRVLVIRIIRHPLVPLTVFRDLNYSPWSDERSTAMDCGVEMQYLGTKITTALPPLTQSAIHPTLRSNISNGDPNQLVQDHSNAADGLHIPMKALDIGGSTIADFVIRHAPAHKVFTCGAYDPSTRILRASGRTAIVVKGKHVIMLHNTVAQDSQFSAILLNKGLDEEIPERVHPSVQSFVDSWLREENEGVYNLSELVHRNKLRMTQLFKVVLTYRQVALRFGNDYRLVRVLDIRLRGDGEWGITST